MFDLLTDNEEEMMYLLISGQDCYVVMEMTGMDYDCYKKTKKSLLHKLHIHKITELLPCMIANNVPVR